MQLVSVAVLAEITNLRPHNIYNLAKRGMPHYRTGARVRFSPQEVLDWMKQRANEGARLNARANGALHVGTVEGQNPTLEAGEASDGH